MKRPHTRRGFLHCATWTVAATLTRWSARDARGAARDGSQKRNRHPDETQVVEALLTRMTLAEKLGQLSQARGRKGVTDSSLPDGTEEDIRGGRVGSFLGLHGAVETKRLQRIAIEESRLGIPLLFADDIIHGFRTIFPVPLAEAASFDVVAVENAARVAAVEAAAHGLHWTFAPMVDIARDPRWGRIVEGSGEDPLLGSVLAAARVRGFQGSDLTRNDTVLATAKHFVAYGAAEGGRDYNTADVSDRTLQTIYLPPFHAAVTAGVQSVMVGFNEIGGVPMHANRELLRGVLRGKWCFDSIVISDYTGIRELIPHGVAADARTAAVLALKAGIDIDMASGTYLQQLTEAVNTGRVSQADIDEATRRVLRAKYRVGLFDDPYRRCDAARERALTLTPGHRAIARDMARKSFVLLKNEGAVLPISRHARTIAVIGPLADDRRAMLGSWIGAGRAEDVITPLAAIRAAANGGARVLYAQGTSLEGSESSGFAEAQAVAREADVCLLFVGEHPDMSGEARSRSSLDLPGIQEQLAQSLFAAGKPVVVVLFAGRPLTIPWLAEHAQAILLAWFPGVEAGHALADVIFGDYSPAGRLPVTFPRDVGQIPVYYNHKNTGRPPDPDHEDEPRKGGNNTSRYLDLPSAPLFPFGHGLSYGAFRYDNLRLSQLQVRTGGSVRLQIDVTNIGARAADEVVQVYLHRNVASVTPPVRQLRDFRRIGLKPAEVRTLSFEIGADEDEPGTVSVLVGGSPTALSEATFEVVSA